MDVADDGMTPAADAVVSPSQQVTPTKGPRPVFNADGKQIAPPPAVAEAPATEREAMEVEAPSAYHASTEGSVNTGNLGGGATDAMPEGSAPAAAEPEVVPDGTETVNAEHGDNAETLTPGDFDKSFYYLHFTVDSSEDRSAIPEINPVAFLNAVNKYGSEKSLPEIEPQKGLAGDKTGPWQVYMEGKALAEYLVSSFEPPFPVMFPGEKSLKVNMVARSVDAFIQNANPSANENYIRTSTVYSEIRLQQGFDFSYIFKRHVKASFIAMGLDVVRTARPQMAFEGEKLGASFVGNMINVVLAGKDKSIVEFRAGSRRFFTSLSPTPTQRNRWKSVSTSTRCVPARMRRPTSRRWQPPSAASATGSSRLRRRRCSSAPRCAASASTAGRRASAAVAVVVAVAAVAVAAVAVAAVAAAAMAASARWPTRPRRARRWPRRPLLTAPARRA